MPYILISCLVSSLVLMQLSYRNILHDAHESENKYVFGTTVQHIDNRRDFTAEYVAEK